MQCCVPRDSSRRQDPQGLVCVQVIKRLTPADRSSLLLQYLQQKHGKQESSQPGPVKSTVHFNTQDALKTCKAASHVKQGFEPKQLHESLIRPVQSSVLPGKAGKTTSKLQPVTSRQAVGPASAQNNVDRNQAVKAPTRSRAEGGRKRRRWQMLYWKCWYVSLRQFCAISEVISALNLASSSRWRLVCSASMTQ